MGKEVRKDSLTTMQKSILELEAKNLEMDGKLFATFGKGKNRALIFPTPVTVEKNGAPVADEFLLVTEEGYLAIHFDRNKTGMNPKFVSDEVEENLGKKYGILSVFAGYTDRVLRIGGHHYIDFEKAWEDHVPLFPDGDDKTEVDIYPNCKLVKIDQSQVKEILEANIRRVVNLRATAQQVSTVLSNVG